MSLITLKSLHTYLRLLENAPELQRKMPTTTPAPRTIKEGIIDLGKLIGIDRAVFQNPLHIASLIGPQRFVMMGGEPSVTDHIRRVFESSKVLFMVLIEPTYYVKTAPGQSGPISGGSNASLSAKSASAASVSPLKAEPANSAASTKSGAEPAWENLKPLLLENLPLTCRLFRALFEHILGFAPPPSTQPGNVMLVNELTGRKEHNKTFLATALYILGQEVDRENLVPFMVEQDLFGIHIFEHMLRQRDFCNAYYLYRRLERAFIESAPDEELQLRGRIDQLKVQFGGKPNSAALFESTEEGKVRVDAYQAATDLMEAMALTPWCTSLIRAISLSSAHCLRSIKNCAAHFERFAQGMETKEQANQEIADHLLAFSWQFLADPPTPKTDAAV